MMKQPSPDPLYTLWGDMDAIHCLLFQLNGDSEYLYASTQTGIVHKWNLKSCREECRVDVGNKACIAIRLFKNGFISQMKGGEIKIWEETEGTWNLKTVLNTEYWAFCKLVVYSDEFIVCPEFGPKMRIVALNGETINTLRLTSKDKYGEIMAVKCFTLSLTDYVYILCENGVLTLFQFSGSKVSDCKITADCPMALDFDDDSKGVIGSSGNMVVGFELTSDLQLVRWKEAVITNAGVSCVVIRPDKKVFAAGCWDTRIRLFSMKSFKLLAVLQGHKEIVQDVCYSSAKVQAWDCPWLLAAAGKDGRITLWNLY